MLAEGSEQIMEQYSLFDMAEPAVEHDRSVPTVNSEGFIPAAQLIPEKWEAWKFANSKWTMLGGKPYVIEAVIALLPGNRLYVKEWMLYPFMYEFSTPTKAYKKYLECREKIVEYMKYNDEHRHTWQLDELPELSDMWRYADGEYSCKEYAMTAIHGHLRERTGTEE